jgi:hypothetical protein
MALTVSSHVCQDRRAGGSINFAWAKEIGQVGGPVICEDESFLLAGHTEMYICNLGERCGRRWIQKGITEGFLEFARWWVTGVVRHMEEQSVRKVLLLRQPRWFVAVAESSLEKGEEGFLRVSTVS